MITCVNALSCARCGAEVMEKPSSSGRAALEEEANLVEVNVFVITSKPDGNGFIRTLLCSIVLNRRLLSNVRLEQIRHFSGFSQKVRLAAALIHFILDNGYYYHIPTYRFMSFYRRRCAVTPFMLSFNIILILYIEFWIFVGRAAAGLLFKSRLCWQILVY